MEEEKEGVVCPWCGSEDAELVAGTVFRCRCCGNYFDDDNFQGISCPECGSDSLASTRVEGVIISFRCGECGKEFLYDYDGKIIYVK